MKPLFVLALALLAQAAPAACLDPQFTDPSQVKLSGDAVLIVTHASATYDTRLSSKHGIDEAVSFARRKGIPVIYLQDKTREENYFTSDCPDYRVYSRNGELPFEVQVSRVYIAGGHLEQCLNQTIEGVIYSWARQPARDRTLTFLMDGIYSTGELIEESDAYYQDFDRFKNIIAHRRTDADPMPKFTLLETLGVIGQEENEIEFLSRALPNKGEVLTSIYKVELSLNNSLIRQIQPVPEKPLARLRFNFVDSAARLGEI